MLRAPRGERGRRGVVRRRVRRDVRALAVPDRVARVFDRERQHTRENAVGIADARRQPDP